MFTSGDLLPILSNVFTGLFNLLKSNSILFLVYYIISIYKCIIAYICNIQTYLYLPKSLV